MKNIICFLVAFVLCSCDAPASSPPVTKILIASGGINHFPFAFNPTDDSTLVHYSTHADAPEASGGKGGSK